MPEVVVTDEFKTWYEALLIDEQQSVFRVVTLLEGRGVSLGYPYCCSAATRVATTGSTSRRFREPKRSGSGISPSARRRGRSEALMKVHRFAGLRHKMSRERQDGIRKEAEEELLQMDLRGLREQLGKTQQEIAVLLERSQSQVSETERRQDVRLSTLRSYVEALGGELEVIANFGDKRIKLHSA
jgi:DNA-binding transcriptional regulator YiaG